ncbi:MAG TPA: DinB family protein [Gemmatimonadales bacterium]|nr:DinB family protein [Gemmatimonadales bacterium]
MTAPATAITPPAADEYAPYYGRYTALVPAGVDILDQLDRQREEVLARFRDVPESKGGHRYAPGKWSVRQLVCHLSDTERIMAYRALRIARADTTPLPGFDENAYAPESGADAVPLAGLVAEFADVRRASLALFRHLPPEAWTRRGRASESPFSVRALAWIILGHPIHHLGVLRERYGI